jgi:endonuclease/exonuclease/phosphatase (EEP) superfamily protein YafD
MRHREPHPSWRPSRFPPLWGIFQPRYGGRVALITEHDTAQGQLVAYNLHLESRGPDSIRVAQIQEVLEDARGYPASATILIAGDLNTKNAKSPVIETIRRAGFSTLLGGAVTTKRRQPLDWIFIRGPWTASDARIHYEIRSSDHFPLTLILHPAPLPSSSAPR